MTEGRGTGIPTIQDELAKNGSPRAKIETDEDRSYFLLTLPVHERALLLTPVIGVSEGGQTSGQTDGQTDGQKTEQKSNKRANKTLLTNNKMDKRLKYY